MDDVLPKPVDLDILRRVLEKWGDSIRKDEFSDRLPDPDTADWRTNGPVDVPVLLHGFAGLERNLASGIGSFLRDSPSLLRDIRDALQVADCAKLCEAAHTLNGTAAMFRVASVSGVCAEIERFGAEGRMDRIEECYRRLEVEMRRACEQLALLKVHCQTLASEHPVKP